MLELISRLQLVLLDKTGTLTTGEFRVKEIVCHSSSDQDEVLRLAASLEEGSRHPLAKSIVAEAKSRQLSW